MNLMAQELMTYRRFDLTKLAGRQGERTYQITTPQGEFISIPAEAAVKFAQAILEEEGEL